MYLKEPLHVEMTDKIVLPEGWVDVSQRRRFIVHTRDDRFSLAVVDECGGKADIEVMDNSITEGDPIIEKELVPFEDLNTRLCQLMVQYG